MAQSHVPLPPRRTGSADFPRPALLKILASGMHKPRKTKQPQPRQMPQPRFSLGRPVRPLTAPLQMLNQAALNMAFDLAVGAGGISKGEVVRPSLPVRFSSPTSRGIGWKHS
jgi:hypothetical protein